MFIWQLFLSLLVAFAVNFVSAESFPEELRSDDPDVAKEQKAVYDLILKYQTALNSGDTKTILTLFSPESYSQWNNKPTDDTSEERRKRYKRLFGEEKFETDFQFDSIEVHGNMAFVRTHHERGATVVNIKTGYTSIDLNRELFVLQKINGEWLIRVYMFNTNPIQGEA
ncbi:hypothetical protein [Microbulbifer sp. TYP-18]|uniref:hypothetical protein n=1 Tax=Microbulbifer sp. TYP-18 TaxID=3230024 RepID=UPI0034C6099D